MFSKRDSISYVITLLWCRCFCFLNLAMYVAAAGDVPYNIGGTNVTDVTHITRDSSSVLSIQAKSGADHLVLKMDSFANIVFKYEVTCTNNDRNFTLFINTQGYANVLQLTSSSKIDIKCSRSQSRNNGTFLNVQEGTVNVSLASGVLGVAYIEFTLAENSNDSVSNGDNQEQVERELFLVKVLRKKRPVDFIFRIVVYCVQVFVTMGFGVKLDLQVVKKNLKRPIAPAIGLVGQYIMMPLIACAVAKLVSDDVVVSLGIFVAGCCPGGGGSNMYSYLLKGDISLSITMTTLSTIAALGMLPLWIYTLGRVFTGGSQTHIPFSNVAISLAIIILPLVAGVFLKYKFPKVAAKISKILKPIIVFFAVCLLVIGIYSNLYIFRLFKPKVVIAACLLPYIGYVGGGLMAAICRQSWKKIKTISIETGMQNTSIAFILLTSSFPAPIGDIAAVAPVASAVMTPLPPFIITIIYLTYRRCKKKYQPVPKEADDDDKDVKSKEMTSINSEQGVKILENVKVENGDDASNVKVNADASNGKANVETESGSGHGTVSAEEKNV